MAKERRGGQNAGRFNKVKTTGDFARLTEDKQAEAIKNGIAKQVPEYLHDSDFQRFMFNNNLDGKPQIVDDDALDRMAGDEMFRTVNAVYDKGNNITFSAEEIAQQMQYGDNTRFSGEHSSSYGTGLYFTNNYNGSVSYGRMNGDVSNTAVVRCKLNSKAKVIDYATAYNEVINEVRNRTKIGWEISDCFYYDQSSAVSIWAISKGYNVLKRDVSSSETYYTILDRSAVSMSSNVKAKSDSWK